MIDSRSQNSTLLESCFVGDPHLTRWILKHTVDDLGNSYTRHGEINAYVNKCGNSGASPLYIACQNGHLDIVLQLTMSKCPFWQAIYKGDAPMSVHWFTSVLTFLSNSCSTMSKCPFWQAIYKGDAPMSVHCNLF
jgi:hypothetical protein